MLFLNLLTGNLKNWWDDNTAAKYKEKAQCMIDQFNGFRVEQVGLNVNGINTQGENIADAGGIQEAYLAYGETCEVVHGMKRFVTS